MRRICLVAPTGGGKTVIAAAMIADAVARRDHVVFVGHRRELIEQTSAKLYAAGVDHGIGQAGFPTRPGAQVQVCSIQTLHTRAVLTRAIELPPADLLYIDECHHARARTYERLIAAYPNAILIGMTATPCRSISEQVERDLQRHLDDIDGFDLDDFLFERVAVTPEQITAWNLPTRPTKTEADGNCHAKRFGGESVELDAIPVDQLHELVREIIFRHIDPEALRVLRIAETSERELLLALGKPAP